MQRVTPRFYGIAMARQAGVIASREKCGADASKKRGHPERSVGVGAGGGPTRSEGPREPQDGEREKVCRKVCPELTGFFGCALPATFARRASLRLRMTSDFAGSAARRNAEALESFHTMRHGRKT